ncbi:hypothetical protein BKA04_000951 [Cryobacterium mesophilum]|uniref:DUF3027 domain-containing protein n=1 Tax=Terrimesophilobacter mesophilus TaxID=433647 RepID=UPI001801BFAF|nr:DUF3027 domain-containing protein [Terrimesophilobacter mesophilus]MBB5632728.1 hypothetical protein [Terrimesophilobacter mesophilus]
MPDAADRTPTEEDLTLARAALLDITPAGTIGAPAGSAVEEDGSLTIYFDTTMAGYPGWKWTVSLAHVEGFGASVLETELTPGDGALLSPDWVPWSERLADYKEAQAELAAHQRDGADDEDDSDDGADDDGSDDDSDFDDDDDDDDDVDAHDDMDGIDIDALDDSVNSPGAESALPAVGDDESEEPESQSDDAGPQPPVKPRRNQRAKKQQQHDEGE